MFWCDAIYFEQKTEKIKHFYRKYYILVETVKYTLSFCRNDEKYITISYDYYKTVIKQHFTSNFYFVTKSKCGLMYLLL